MSSSLGRQGQMSYSLSSNLSITAATITSSGVLTLPASSGTYLITTTGYGAGGGGTYSSASSWGVTHSTDNRDVVIKRKNGKEIRVGDSLEMIMELLMIIPEDRELFEKNPALKDAYDHHQQVIREVFTDDRLRESFDTYHTIRRLVKDETEDG